MAEFTRRFLSLSQRQDKSQPRFLSRREAAQQCSWLACTAKATNMHKENAYCASHLLTSLQKQWQE